MGNIIPLLSFSKRRRRAARLHDGEILQKLLEEIVLWEILPRLPAKSLIKFKCISRRWHDHIANNGEFIEAHRRHHCRLCGSFSCIAFLKNGNKERDYRKQYKMSLLVREENDDIGLPRAEKLEMSYLLSNKIPDLHEEINIIGSSNGLVLISRWYYISEEDLILWNPVTKEFRNLPTPILSNNNNRSFVNFKSDILVLGFDEKTRDHKVVRVFETICNQDNESEGSAAKSMLNFQVYTKNSDSWRIETITIPGYTFWNTRIGVSLNGDFYFLALQVTWRGSHKVVILSFRYGSEEVQSPIDLPHYDDQDFRLKEYKLSSWKEDSLALISQNPSPGIVIDFWVMVEDNNNNNNKGFHWSKLFQFDCPYLICGVWRDKFMLVQRSSRRRIELLLWDPEVNCKTGALSLKKQDIFWYFFDAINYVPSLVSVYPESWNRR